MRAVKSRREKVACDDLYREAASAEGQGCSLRVGGRKRRGGCCPLPVRVSRLSTRSRPPRAIALRSACVGSDRVKAITCSRSATQMGSRKCGAELPV